MEKATGNHSDIPPNNKQREKGSVLKEVTPRPVNRIRLVDLPESIIGDVTLEICAMQTF